MKYKKNDKQHIKGENMKKQRRIHNMSIVESNSLIIVGGGGEREREEINEKLGIALTYLGLKSPMKIYVSESINNKPC
jgi:hypothetical protein